MSSPLSSCPCESNCKHVCSAGAAAGGDASEAEPQREEPSAGGGEERSAGAAGGGGGGAQEPGEADAQRAGAGTYYFCIRDSLAAGARKQGTMEYIINTPLFQIHFYRISTNYTNIK